jgi:hypothetical protein
MRKSLAGLRARAEHLAAVVRAAGCSECQPRMRRRPLATSTDSRRCSRLHRLSAVTCSACRRTYRQRRIVDALLSEADDQVEAVGCGR